VLAGLRLSTNSVGLGRSCLLLCLLAFDLNSSRGEERDGKPQPELQPVEGNPRESNKLRLKNPSSTEDPASMSCLRR